MTADTLDENAVRDILRNQKLVRDVSILPRGHIRIETALNYPDGTSIEVFVRRTDLTSEIFLTDLGQTHAWLLNMQVRPWLSKKRREFLADALRTYGIGHSGGELTLQIQDRAELIDGILRLSQACLRVADLTYTRRASLQTSFTEEVEEVVDDIGVPYDIGVELPGKYGELIRVDFKVATPRMPSLMLAWSSGNASQAHVTINEILRKWIDLSERPEHRVTVFDDKFDVYRSEDMKRIRDWSTLIAISDRAELRTLLAAA